MKSLLGGCIRTTLLGISLAIMLRTLIQDMGKKRQSSDGQKGPRGSKTRSI